MASRHEIVSIDFRANAGKANPAIESLRKSAEETNKEITKLKDNLAKGGSDAQVADWTKQLNVQEKKLKALQNAENNLIKGVGTLNQAIEAFNNGSLDQMSAKFQKAAKNAAELQKLQLDPKGEKYNQFLSELEAFTARVDENLQKMKLHTDDLIATIQAGGKVSASELRQEINGLTELLDLIPKGTEEYKQYASQLQTIQTHVTTLSENERRLAGKIVTVADAMKMANASTREAAEQRLKDAAAAKQQAETERATLETQREASRLKIETAAKEAASIKEQITEQEKLVKSQEALYEASDRADKEVNEARKKRDAARESTKQYTDAITTAANKVADLKKQLEELNATTAKPKVDASELEQIERKLKNIDNLRKQQQEVIDAYEAKYGKTSDEQFDAQDKVRAEAVRKDVAAREAAVDKVNNKWEEFWNKQEAAAQEFARSLGKSLDDIIPEEITSEHLSGPLAKSAQAAYKVTARREYELGVALFGEGKLNQDREFARRHEGDDSPEAKVIESLQRKYREYTKELREVNAVDTESKKIREEQRKESEAYYSALGQMQGFQKVENDLLQQKEALLKQSTQANQAETEAVKDKEAETQKLIQLQKELGEAMAKAGYKGKDADSIDLQDSLKRSARTGYAQWMPNSQTWKHRINQDSTMDEWVHSLANARGFEDNFKPLAKETIKNSLSSYLGDGKSLSDLKQLQEEWKKVASGFADQQANDNGYKEAVEYIEKLINKTVQLKEIEEKRAAVHNQQSIVDGIEQITQATEQSVDADKKKAEVTKQLADAQAELDKATKDAEEPKKKLAKAEDDLTEAEKKQTKAYEDLDAAREKQDFAGQNEKLDQLQRNYDELTGSIEKEKQALTENATAAKEAYDKETEAAIEMAQAQNYSQKSLEDSIALLEKQSKVETDPKKYKEMTTAIETMQQRVKEMTGEWMSYAEAEKYAESIGTDGFIATSDQLQKATQSLTRYKDTLIKTIQQKRDDGKATAEEEAELKKVEAELKKMKFEMDNANMSSKRMHEILKDPKSAKNIEELSAAIKRSTQELKLMEETIGKDNAKYKEMAEQTKKATIEQKNMEAQFKASASAFEKAWSRLKTYVGLYVGAAVAMQKITATMGDLMELSDKMGEVRKTTGFTADEVGRLSDNLKKLDVRTSLTSLMELSSLAGSVGLKTQQDVQGFTEAANQLLIALPEMGNESARTLIKIAQATGDLQKNNNDVRETLEKVGSTIIALRANSASAAGPITDFVSRVGAVGAQAGISIDQIAALGSTIDALGGRVEMSATALSRMIPAIRNNSYAIANSINVTESYLKSLAPMEQMVLIFQKMRDSIKGIDTSTEEGQKQMADNVEAILGKSSTMREVMKDLEQQGARAGIVFGLLSQNVDELQKQLGIAGEAYKDNIALQEEFNKMNDTTAAKWARLKNQLEEMFVSDSMQRRLGWIIDRLRDLVDFIAEDGPIAKGLKVIMAYMIALKLNFGSTIAGAGDALKNLGTAFMALANTAGMALGNIGAKLGLVTEQTRLARMEWKKMDAAMKANIWGAIITAIGALVYKIYDWIQATKEAAAEIGRFNQQLHDEKKALDDLFTPLKNSNLAQEERSKLITEINSKYSRYLGYMLSETTQATQLAEAHALIAKRIREEAYEKRILEQEDSVRAKHGDDLNARYGWLEGSVRRNAKANTDVGSVADALKAYIDKNLGEVENDYYMGSLRPSNESVIKFMDRFENYLERLAIDGKINRGGIEDIKNAAFQYLDVAKAQAVDIEKATANTRADLRNVQREIGGDINANLNRLVDNLANFGKTTNEQGVPTSIERQEPPESKKTWQERMKGETYDWIGNTNAQSNIQIPLPSWKPNINKENIEEVKQFVEAQDQLRGYLEANAKDIDEQTRKTAEMYLLAEDEMAELRKLIPTPTGDTGGGGGGNKPYGDFNRVTSPYGDWDADSLVNRRKEMLERVRSLANGADVQAVLSEDAKFISEAVRKNITTTKQAIEWYNAERLKIQDAMHERYLTNTGDWMDPKKGGKKASKMVQDEMKYYLDELDAYYTERKAMIQEARNDEQISEGEAWRRTLQNDAEWQQRRAELQQLYAKKAEKVTQEEQDAIFEILSDRTDESIDYIQKDIEQTVKFIEKVGKEKGKPAMERILGDLDLNIEKAFLRQRNAIGKQMEAIADIIEKERPFNGITENLRENLTKMGILQADFEKRRLALLAKREDTSEIDDEYAREIPKRLAFILTEAEHAYNTTIEDVMRRMADTGMTAWAEELQANPQMQEAMMAELHNIFDKIQEAIKKEASLWKKEAENMWNNILMPDGQTTMKQMADKAVSVLSMEQGKVSRANSMIGAGQASERVADRLAIQQMKIQLAMQEHYYNLMKQRGLATIEYLKRQAKLAKERGDTEAETKALLDKQHAEMALNVATAKEQVELAKQREEIIARTEESERRLYDELRSWADLLSSSLQSVFEASNAGMGEYYNEMAKLRLTGSNGKGGTYIVIDNAGSSSAEAHYETLSDEEYLRRQMEIEQQNATAEAWKNVMDDIAEKMNDMITDQLNAMLQNAAVDQNTTALGLNTAAIAALTAQMQSGGQKVLGTGDMSVDENGIPNALKEPESDQSYLNNWEVPADNSGWNPETNSWQVMAEESTAATETILRNQKEIQKGQVQTDKKSTESTQAAFAKMTLAANMYGIAYNAMSSDNLSTAQKFGMMAVQAAGQVAMTMLTVDMAKATAKANTDLPGIYGWCINALGPIAGPILFGVLSASLGGLLGMAAGAIGKSKSEISQVTGAKTSSGRLATGMLTYAEGNVNEFTDPNSLTPGKHYNVDGADGNTYRAKYMGRNPKTHITNGPEFHLVGEKGREAIIDAKTTRNIQMNDPEIWRTIQILYNGGSMSHYRPRKGIRTYADGNLDEFEDNSQFSQLGNADLTAMQASLDRNSAIQEALLERLSSPIKAEFNVYGPKGLIDSYDTGKKEVQRHGQRY